MGIDYERLKAERGIDPFSFPPADVAETVAFTAAVLRDSCLGNPEIMESDGFGISRVTAHSPTPRLRQRLAILGWAPLEPASDERWFIDEPVKLPQHANALVAAFTARYYAQEMDLLFAPDDGRFSGEAWHHAPRAVASAGERRGFVRLMAERRYVAVSVAGRRCPATVLHQALGRDLGVVNEARSRAGLDVIARPPASTLRLWLGEFGRTHAERAGLGADWRNYECVGGA